MEKGRPRARHRQGVAADPSSPRGNLGNGRAYGKVRHLRWGQAGAAPYKSADATRVYCSDQNKADTNKPMELAHRNRAGRVNAAPEEVGPGPRTGAKTHSLAPPLFREFYRRHQ